MRQFILSRLNNEKFPALTGIRAVAAFMVFFHHLPVHIKPGFLTGLQLTFYWGVDLFFVLSGFMITYRYYEKTVLSAGWLFRYFTNRFARIYPVYLLVLTVVILLLKNFEPVFLLQNYTLTHYLFFIFKSHGMALSASWSLTVEECFYLFAPFIFIICKKYNLWVPFVLTVVLLLIILYTYCSNATDVFLVFSGTFFGCFLKFYTGVYLALMILKKEKSSAITKTGQRCTVLGFIAIAILIIPLIYVTNKSHPIQYPIIIFVNNFLMPFPVAVFYYGLVCENTLLKRLLSGYTMRLSGRASYTFYLLHLPVITYLATPFIRPYFGNAHYNLYVITIFTLTLIMAVIIFLFYEHPLNVFIRKKISALAKKQQ